MKKIFIVPLIAILTLIFCSGTVTYAQETEETLTDPDITPNSPLYFMDKWGKSLSLMFTFNAESKVHKALRYADERMAEIDAMMSQNKIKDATQAANEYQKYLEVANKYMEQVRLKGSDISEEVVLMMEKHLGYIFDNTENATEDALMMMTQTRERTMTCQEVALKTMAQSDPGKAVQLMLQLMGRQLNRVREQAEEAEDEDIQARLEVFNRLGNLGKEISQIAKRRGEETIIDQMLGLASANQLEILTEVQEQLQGEAQEAAEAAMQCCVQNYEQVVTRLQVQNQLGEVPEDISEAVRQRISSGESRGK